jgi:signal transduction histidine kinase
VTAPEGALDGRGPAQPCDEPDFAARTLVGWHLLFGLMVAAALAIVVANGDGPVPVLLLALLVLAYAFLGLTALRRHSMAFAVAYLAVAWTLLLLLEAHDPATLVLLFALYPQVFVLLPRKGSIAATVVLTLAFSLVLVGRGGWTREAWLWNGLGAVGYIVFALAIGLYIDGLIRESRRNRDLLNTLRATQDELAAAEREAGALEERERIARDIHDTIAQGFTSIVMLSQAGESALDRGDEEHAARRFAEIQETARDNLAEARALVAAMAPPSLERDGLVGALRRLVERHSAETDVPVRFSVDGPPRTLAPSSEVTALRAAQESLANARRHAGATSIEVVLTFDEDGATVTVTDDGVGFDPTAPREGFGLDGLASRVQVVGGLVDVASGIGAGTRVRVRVP